MYNVIVQKRADKVLEKIDEPDYSKIKKAIINLAENPRPPGSKKLKGRAGYRIRIRDYRVIYLIKDNKLVVM